MDDWRVIATSPITGAQLWYNGEQVAACREWEEPAHASALVSGRSYDSVAFVKRMFREQYWYEYQYDF